MKTLQIFLLILIGTVNAYSQLNTKYIASKYGEGIVKIILMDPELEKQKPGTGYLSRGSGFFVTNDGYIFTNRHVVEACVTGYLDYDYIDSRGQKRQRIAPYSDDLIADKSFVKAYGAGYTVPVIQVFHGTGENDYTLYDAKVVSIGMGAFDGALLKVIRDEHGNTGNFNFTPLPMGNSDKVQQGEQFCVFGYPAQVKGGTAIMLRDMNTLSKGIMSGYDFVMNEHYGYLKTDAKIHAGNSGGPVFNEENKVIGIATAKGVATGIGLVGGINGMYYVSAIDSEVQERLKARGLIPPKRAFSISTITGNKIPMKTLAQINGSKSSSVKKTKTYNSPSTGGAKVFFSNFSPKENNNYLPSASKRYSRFTLDRKKGGVIWVYLDTSPSNINTTSIAVLIDKLKNGKYRKFKDQVYTVSSTGKNTYFPYTFNEKGTFKFSFYSKETKYMASGIVTLAYK